MNEDKRLELKKEIAKGLLDIEAVFLHPEDPFTWASGIKSPIYCDNRLILTAPKVRDKVEQAIADVVKEEYPEAEVLMGTSTAGIAHAAIAASILDMPMGYVRSGNKDHGRGNRIEGRLLPGQKVVVVEDLISTGGSAIERGRCGGAWHRQHFYLWYGKRSGSYGGGRCEEHQPFGF